jgi:hypothetical protein
MMFSFMFSDQNNSYILCHVDLFRPKTARRQVVC